MDGLLDGLVDERVDFWIFGWCLCDGAFAMGPLRWGLCDGAFAMGLSRFQPGRAQVPGHALCVSGPLF